MKRPTASMRSLTLVKRLPRRMACPVMMPKKIPIVFSHDPEVGEMQFSCRPNHLPCRLYLTVAAGSLRKHSARVCSVLTRR